MNSVECCQRRFAKWLGKWKTDWQDGPDLMSSTPRYWMQPKTITDNLGTKDQWNALEQHFAMHFYLAHGRRIKGQSKFVPSTKKRPQLVKNGTIDFIPNISWEGRRGDKRCSRRRCTSANIPLRSWRFWASASTKARLWSSSDSFAIIAAEKWLADC